MLALLPTSFGTSLVLYSTNASINSTEIGIRYKYVRYLCKVLVALADLPLVPGHGSSFRYKYEWEQKMGAIGVTFRTPLRLIGYWSRKET